MANKDVWKIFSDECPGVAGAYQKLFNEMNFEDALDDKTRALVLVVSIVQPWTHYLHGSG